MGVWLKHELSILASFGPYISIFSGHGSRNLGGVAQLVGVATQKWAWSEIFRAHFLYYTLCPGLSSHKLGSYGPGLVKGCTMYRSHEKIPQGHSVSHLQIYSEKLPGSSIFFGFRSRSARLEGYEVLFKGCLRLLINIVQFANFYGVT